MVVEQVGDIYKCSICGNVVSVLEVGGGTLVCCDKDMDKMQEKTGEAEGKEKHVPVIESTDAGIRVTVGSVPHPMEEDHYIELIQLVQGDKIIAGKKLNPGDAPVAEFCFVAGEGIKARAYCNKHGLWISS